MRSICCNAQGVGEMAAVLTQRLKSPRTGLTEATEAISALLQLQADDAKCMQNVDPVNLYVATLVSPCRVRCWSLVFA